MFNISVELQLSKTKLQNKAIFNLGECTKTKQQTIS